MSSNLYRRNDAIALNGNTVNGKTADIAITTRGSDFYFAICAVMGVTSLTVLGLSYLKPRNDRIFFYITAALNATACIAYFAMGSNLGFTPINVEFVRSNPKVNGTAREIFYARYIDWTVTTPLLLLDLLLTAGLPWPSIVWVMFLDEAMIVTGLIGALTRSRYKFGFYAFGVIAMFGVFYELAVVGRAHARALGNDVYRVFLSCGVITLFIWLLYPIAWGLSEGGNIIAPDSEAVFYGILDLCAKPVFSAALIYGHWNIQPARLGLRIRDPSEQANNVPNSEKRNDHVANPSTTATTTGTNMGNVAPVTATSAGHQHDQAGSGNLQNSSAGFHHDTEGRAPVYDNVTTS